MVSARFWVPLIILSIPALPSGAAGVTQHPRTSTVDFPAWGFSLKVPATAVKHALPSTGDVELSEVYSYGETIYWVRLTRTPPDTLTSTAIEQAIQALSATASALGRASRWELETPQAVLFKGLNGPIKPEEDAPEAALLKKALWGREPYQSLCMAPVGDESSPMLTLAVIGLKNRAAEIESLAKFLAFGFARSKPGQAPVSPAAPTVAPRPSHTPSPHPAPAAPPKKRPLKKGDIELVGQVTRIDDSARTLEMLVDQIRMPHTGVIRLDPPRHKIVHFAQLPGGVSVGSRILVAGYNTGVGEPIKADVVLLAGGQ